MHTGKGKMADSALTILREACALPQKQVMWRLQMAIRGMTPKLGMHKGRQKGKRLLTLSVWGIVKKGQGYPLSPRGRHASQGSHKNRAQHSPNEEPSSHNVLQSSRQVRENEMVAALQGVFWHHPLALQQHDGPLCPKDSPHSPSRHWQ